MHDIFDMVCKKKKIKATTNKNNISSFYESTF